MTSADRQWWNRYSRYLNSQGWELTREACFRRDGYRCRRCGAGNDPFNPLQANHLSYEAYNRTGRTSISDLETLCRSCHQTITGRKFHRTFGQWLWQFWPPDGEAKSRCDLLITWLAVMWIHEGSFIPPEPYHGSWSTHLQSLY